MDDVCRRYRVELGLLADEPYRLLIRIPKASGAAARVALTPGAAKRGPRTADQSPAWRWAAGIAARGCPWRTAAPPHYASWQGMAQVVPQEA